MIVIQLRQNDWMYFDKTYQQKKYGIRKKPLPIAKVFPDMPKVKRLDFGLIYKSHRHNHI